MIYADNAATTRLSATALAAMPPYLTEQYGNPSSLYTLGQTAATALAQARETVARCLHCRPEEIVFTSGGSEADNQAILSAARWGKRQGKTHIISTAFEHHAVLHTLQKLEKEGFTVTLLDVHADGRITPQQVEAAITQDTCLVTVMYANNEIGTIQPIGEIGAICRARKVPFHTDAVQAAGHLAIDVGAEQIDMLSLSAHKFHGPKVTALRDKLIDGLAAIPHAALNGDRDHRLPGNVNVCFEGIEGESLLLLLDDRGICASSGSACTSGSLDPSHVLLAIGRPHEVAHGSLRLSLCEENTEAEVDAMLREIPKVVEYLRNMSPVWRELQKGARDYVIQ